MRTLKEMLSWNAKISSYERTKKCEEWRKIFVEMEERVLHTLVTAIDLYQVEGFED